jgi:hypothetical protein
LSERASEGQSRATDQKRINYDAFIPIFSFSLSLTASSTRLVPKKKNQKKEYIFSSFSFPAGINHAGITRKQKNGPPFLGGFSLYTFFFFTPGVMTDGTTTAEPKTKKNS